MEGTPAEEILAKLSQLPVELFSILKEGTTGPPFLPSPQPHPVFRENKFEEGKTRDRKPFPKLGRAARLGPPPHPQPTCLPAPPISDHLQTASHAWH